MRKLYASLFTAFIGILLSSSINYANAQTTFESFIPTGVVYVSDTDPGAIVFGVKNENSSAIIITGIGSYAETGHAATYKLWYHPTQLTGAPGAITAANGWIELTPSGAVTATSNGVIPVLSGLNLVIPANTTYRLALESTATGPYYGTANSTPTEKTLGGLTVYFQNNPISPTYAGIFPAMTTTFTPRSFFGTITFVPQDACTGTPTPGTAVASLTNACAGVNFTLDLTGNSIGTGQTYQWQSSPDNNNWTNVGTASSSPIFTTSHAATTWYRAEVTCGAATAYSTSVQVSSQSSLSGVYTINNAQPTGGNNFQSFTDAVNALQCGVSGPVVFNVEPGSGPYNEQITIPSISGVSAVNTVTFNGNNTTIQATPNTTDRHIIRLNGADRVIIKKLNINSLATDFGWGVHLTNGANNNIIDSCIINLSLVTSTTQSNSGGIIVSGSNTSVTTDGSASNNTFSNNRIMGGYQGIIITGTTGSTLATNNLVTKNVIEDFYADGISMTENDGAVISFNDISRANRTAVTTFTGIEVASGCINVVLNGNRIHDTHNTATTQTGTAYGIFTTGADAPAGSENKFYNNLIYNFNSASGIQYGIYNSSSDGAWYYHNTVVLDHAASTGGTTRGFFQTTLASNIQFKNNIIYITRAGTGVKYAIYLGTTTSTVESNNNVLYINAPAGTNGVGFYSTGFTTLADWKTANGGAYDQLSVDYDPQFMNPGAGDFTPINVQINNIGANVGVATDILNAPRLIASPDPGAYEFSIGNCTNPPVAGTAVANMPSVCSGADVTLDLAGNSFGDGQTYQWQSSPDNVNWTNIGTATTATSYIASQSQSTWYRAGVQCSGGTVVYSTSVQVLTPALVSGNFTINNTQPTSGANFNSFADAINHLLCGINGPVVFDVVQGTGPYNEQVVIPSINGTSSTNTITFNGNDAIIQATPTTADRHIIRLDGADYIVIKRLILSGQATDYGWGVHLTNGADHNVIDSLTINISGVTSTTQSNSGGIVVSGSTTSVTTDGSASHNTFSNNTILGGYQGIIITGSTNSTDAVGNIITKNTIQDFYADGISITENDGAVVSFNDISRATRAAVTTFAGIEVASGCINVLVDGNKIHDTHNAATTQTGTAYGIYSNGCDAPVGSENKFTNNLIYNFNSASGTQYGIYNSSSNGAWYFHNTVVLDNASSTGGITRGFYQLTTATDIQFKNNIVYITRGGTGAKYAIYLGTTTSVVESNNNVLYVNAPAGTNGVGFYSTGYATLVDWQGANSGAWDQQSVDHNPTFNNPGALDYTPTNALVFDIGANVGVAADILGEPRTLTNPDPGAFEIPPVQGIDLGAVVLRSPVQQTCFSNTETVTVSIRNYGANTHNFVTNPVTVNAAVTGPNATAFTPVVINAGTLASGDSLDVVISTTYDMSAAGTYSFTATAVVTGDLNTINDAMQPVDIIVAPLSAGTVTSIPGNFCVTGGIPNLVLSDY